MAVDSEHMYIGIQMKRKQLTNSFIMISNWKNPLISTYFKALRVKLIDKLRYLIYWTSITSNLLIFSDISFRLKSSWNLIYTAPAAQGLRWRRGGGDDEYQDEMTGIHHDEMTSTTEECVWHVSVIPVATPDPSVTPG